MNLLLKLAWRNIWRNKRRSIITLAAVSFAALLAIGMRGIQIGTYSLNYKTAIELFTSYVQIQKTGYRDNPSLNNSFVFDNDIKNILEEESYKFTPRIYADGLISYKDASLGAALFGIVPSTEKNVTTVTNKLSAGTFFDSDNSNQIVVGAKLLENLNAKIGDEVVILSQGFDGSLGNQKFTISGTVKMGMSEFDGMAVFIGLSSLQHLLGMDDRINAIAFDADGLESAEILKRDLMQKISDPELSMLLWEELLPELKQLIEFDNVSGIFFLGILIVIVAFGILNTVLMSVTERFKEFGVVLSIGMPQHNLVKLVYIETIMITIIGLILGNILGYAVNYYIVQNPIILGGDLSRIYEEYNFVPRLESSLNAHIFFNVSLSIVIISIIACFYPAYKVYKLEPLKGIRHT
jgi:ABC-type lipoprotein release transport system permease subunit